MELLKNLNSVQRTAAIKAMTANDYLLLRGLPGTGKTQTLTTIIRLLMMMGKSILITSHTHSAVDNVLLRLLRDEPDIQFLRLGAKGRIKAPLWPYAESELTKDCRTPDDFEEVYNRYVILKKYFLFFLHLCENFFLEHRCRDMPGCSTCYVDA